MRLLLKQLYLSLSVLILICLYHTSVMAQACSVSIAIGQVKICEGETTTITTTASFSPTNWGLYKDDVFQTSNATGKFTISEPGRYYVRAINPGGSCDSQRSDNAFTLQVNPKPLVPEFVTSPNVSGGNVCSGDEITFSIKNPESGVTYRWSFGDLSTATTTGNGTIKHTYIANGTGIKDFDVTVEAIIPSSGCNAMYTEKATIVETPIISFTEKSGFQVCLPKNKLPADTTITAELTNTTKAPYLNDIRTYYVDWGDGKGEVVYSGNPFPLTSPRLDTLGNYEIKVRAVNKNGCQTIFEETFHYSQEPSAGFEIDKQREKQDQMPKPCEPVIVTPTDTASGGDLTYKWSVLPAQGWTFVTGDATSAAPVFKFSVSGVYTIEQIVSNACGSDTTSQGIVVGWPQVQPPSGGTFCGPTTIDFNSSGPAGGGGSGPGSILIDKNLGEQVTVNVKITGPGPAFSQTYSSENFNFSYSFSTPGRYFLTIEARNECGSSNQITGGQAVPIEYVILKQPTAPSVNNPGIVCEGDAVKLTPTGGGPLFAWFDDNTPGASPLQINPTFTTPALSAGTNKYYVAALDTANGIQCLSPLREIPITVKERIANNTIDGNDTRNVCKGGTVATLTGSMPTGGDTSVPYTYTWIQSTTGPDVGFTAAIGTNNNQNYTPGAISTTTWFRRVVGSASCSADTSSAVQIIAVDPVPAAANVIGPAQEICVGDTPQQLVGSQPSGGAGPPYTFLWEISTTGPSSGFRDAPAPNNVANYTIQNPQAGDTWFRRKVISGECASPSNVIKITIYPKLANNTITPATQDVCEGVATSSLTGSTPTGGKPGEYKYEWISSASGTAGSFMPVAGNSNTPSYTPGPLTATTYFKRVVTSAGCGADTSGVAIIRIRPAIIGNSVSADQEVCSGVVPAELVGTMPSGGNGGFTYRWESSISGPNNGFTPAPVPNTGQNYTPPALTRTTWFRRVAISQTCENASAAVAITILPLPAAPSLVVKNARACLGGSATLEVLNANGNDYKWYTTDKGGSPIFVGPKFVTPELFQNTTYYVEAVNNTQCVSATRTVANVIIVKPVADAGKDVTVIQGRTVELRASGGTTYLWEPAEGLSNPNVANPVARPDVTTTYTVTVTTAEGCVDKDDVTVEVIPAISIPNAFTPNRDNVNEVWELGNIENYPDVKVEIFNRWGNMIFTSNGYGTPWDGTYNGENLPVATYYYMIYLNKSEKPISGHVTIIR